MSESELADLFERPPRPRLRIGVGAAVVLVLVVLAGAITLAALRPTPSLGALGEVSPTESLQLSATEPPAGVPSSEGATTLLVHVVGAVTSPGVYEVPSTARVVDGIAAAGGLAGDADPSLLNMARTLVDGEQLRVPRIGETPSEPVGGGAGPTGAGGAAGGGLVNLNTASAVELEELPRIGPAMSSRIIDHREQNGGFGAVEELKEVAGIGDATYEGLVDLVTV
ncbi:MULTISPECIES: ComEA family DNA-binding protein [unclassified Pseudoclavibacter]|uniref:ComEA family DNA-binding protein n=1 Tax=unclassified Pseudoclavibacter TaxID=2615177 RepID=UPI0021588B66|nr:MULTISPECIES: ComEA family DNA-binding protein [unclassified Pseudoclavibacter]